MEYSLLKIYNMFINKDEFYDEELKCTRLLDLKDIADRFKIPVDRSRIKDYKILDINVGSSNNYLKIYDKKLKKEYTSKYLFLSNILSIKDVFDNVKTIVPPQFINVKVISKKSECEYAYYVDGDVPIIERLSYIDECNNDFYNKLQITKYNEVEFSKNYSSLVNPKIICNVDFIKGINCNGLGVSETVCLSKKHTDYLGNDTNYYCDEISIYPKIRNTIYDRCSWVHNNKVNYYINSLKDDINDFRGVCLEEIICYSNDMLYNILVKYNNRASYRDVSLCNDHKDVQAILLFSNNTNYDKKNEYTNFLEVFKTDKDIVIRYSVVPENALSRKTKHRKTYTKDIIIPKRIDKCFDYLELDDISNKVLSLNDDDFIKRVLYEIDKYKNLLQFKGNNYYFDDPLSPLLLSNIDINDIEKMISRNKDYYFNATRCQFDKLINKKQVDSNKTKVLKYRKNKIKE